MAAVVYFSKTFFFPGCRGYVIQTAFIYAYVNQFDQNFITQIKEPFAKFSEKRV